MISKMIDLGMQYPFVETERFYKFWPGVEGASEEDKIRYNNYCCYAFNVMERICEHHNVREFAERSQIGNMLLVEEIISMHCKWWANEAHNGDGYSVDFKRFVNETIKHLNKEGTKNAT